MKIEIITEDDEIVIRRLILEPGESSHWHRDNCARFSVIVRGSRLDIEFQDSGTSVEIDVHPGMTGWDEPEDRVHRAVNTTQDIYEEVVTFYRNGPNIEPQPQA